MVLLKVGKRKLNSNGTQTNRKRYASKEQAKSEQNVRNASEKQAENIKLVVSQ